MTEFVVPHAVHACRVVIGERLAGLGPALDAVTPSSRTIVVTDDNVAPHWVDPLLAALPGRDVTVVALPAGEVHKTVDTWQHVVDRLLELGVDRTTTVVGLGGGVVTDIAGFAASTALRGLPVVHVPTTVLGMVDASIGGKTGVNHARGKNLVGAFYPPRLVWMATETLSTLPDLERRAGLGEVVKTAALGDLGLLDALLDGEMDRTPASVIERCARVKGRIVAEDEREAGSRALLNAGHTVGHAIETALGHGTLAHGLAVAIGLVDEARFAVREGYCDDPAWPDRLAAVLVALGLPTTRPAMKFDVFEAALRADKKRAGASLRVPLPERAGVYRVRALDSSRIDRLVQP